MVCVRSCECGQCGPRGQTYNRGSLHEKHIYTLFIFTNIAQIWYTYMHTSKAVTSYLIVAVITVIVF